MQWLVHGINQSGFVFDACYILAIGVKLRNALIARFDFEYQIFCLHGKLIPLLLKRFAKCLSILYLFLVIGILIIR